MEQDMWLAVASTWQFDPISEDLVIGLTIWVIPIWKFLLDFSLVWGDIFGYLENGENIT